MKKHKNIKKLTIAQQLNIKDFPFEIKDKHGNMLYIEHSDHTWIKYKFDENRNIIYFENSNGYWYKNEFDENNVIIYKEDSKLGLMLDIRNKETNETKDTENNKNKVSILAWADAMNLNIEIKARLQSLLDVPLYYINIPGLDIKDHTTSINSTFLRSAIGEGETPAEAMENLIKKISNKIGVLNYGTVNIPFLKYKGRKL